MNYLDCGLITLKRMGFFANWHDRWAETLRALLLLANMPVRCKERQKIMANQISMTQYPDIEHTLS